MNLPLSIRDVKPHYAAEKLPNGYRADGLPDGVHTGGVYRYNGEIWKPLDGRPYMNADFCYPTLEAEFLDEMSDLASFPRNWRVEDANGRKWLVRPEVYVLGEKELRNLDKEVVLQIEADVREANRRGWEVNDAFQIAFDEAVCRYFILDCSSAQRMNGQGAYAADEFDRIIRFFKLCGYDALAKFRQNARHITSSIEFLEAHPETIDSDALYVYASFSRPLSLMWARLGDDAILEHQMRDGAIVPHTWVITKKPLSPDILYQHELTWGYSRV